MTCYNATQQVVVIEPGRTTMMRDKPLTIEIPEDLLNRAQLAHIDVRRTLIEALEEAVAAAGAVVPPDAELVHRGPSRAEIEAAIQESEARLASPDAARRVLGLNAGTVWISDDFDEELPDTFWLGDDA